ncbi:unnamed protein product, partial [Polarella glacialis]
ELAVLGSRDALPDFFATDFFAEDDEAEEEEEVKSSTKSRKAQKRSERACARAAHEKANTRELRALFEVLKALPAALPGLASEQEAARTLATDSTLADSLGGKGKGKVGKPRNIAPDLEEVESALAAAEAALQTPCPYRSLPEVCGPCGGVEVLASMVDRPPKYQEKYLAQELSLLAKVWALAGGKDDPSRHDEGRLAVIDIGAGNGCLALLAAVLLDAHAVMIDHTLPPEPLRVEDKVPEPWKSLVLRVTGDVADLDAMGALEPPITDIENDSQEDPGEVRSPSKLGVRTTVDEPLSASQAIEVLQAGNRRFVQGDAKAGGLDQRARRALASHGQRPVATVIGCADSRCPVEQLFDARPGDLFVLRNAGNTCTHAEGSMVGSVEYSVAILETKMILVLGHTGCGAIMGATKLFLERSAQKYIKETCQKDAQETTDQSTQASDSEQPPQPGKSKSTLLGLLDALVPVAERACVELGGSSSTEEIAAHAVKVNLWRTINFLLSYSRVIREKVASGELELQGAIYNMSSGAVEFLGKSPKQAQLLNYDGHV